ncbi:TPA: hypothetical protein N0F65_012934 [Lagenidium giganteum]|uniref:Uncharacterized protein n=1 Tax=Lagenidium giganteum TaxID=4803 RepID=A0AAV2YZA0_9STRA|nr:TPA: hypothetical protein N0F65_012934 [Lagenidium giganteum]
MCYNFYDVWAYFKLHGWTSRHAGRLSYDHYYVQPGANVRTGVEGVDYFHGELALVNHAKVLQIFGEDDSPDPQRRPVALPSARKPMPSTGHGARPQDAISLTSDSDEDDEEASEQEAEYLCQNGMPRVKITRRSPSPATRETSGGGATNIKSRNSATAAATATAAAAADGSATIGESESQGTSTQMSMSSTEEEPKVAAEPLSRAARPKLSTTTPVVPRKQSAPAAVPAIRKYKTAVRCLAGQPGATGKALAATHAESGGNNDEAEEDDDKDDQVEPDEANLKRPREPLRVDTARKSTERSNKRPRTDVSPRDGFRGGKTPSPAHKKKAYHDGKDSACKPNGAKQSKATVEHTKTLLQLNVVTFPSRPDQKYALALMASEDGKEHSVCITNAQTHEQRRTVFTDITKVNPSNQVPEKPLFDALKCCLKALADDPAAVSTPSEAKLEPGRVDLIAGAKAGDLTLRLTFPCYDFWALDHDFPMEPPSPVQQIASLEAALVTTRTQLAQAQEQIKLCQQANALLVSRYRLLRKSMKEPTAEPSPSPAPSPAPSRAPTPPPTFAGVMKPRPAERTVSPGVESVTRRAVRTELGCSVHVISHWLSCMGASQEMGTNRDSFVKTAQWHEVVTLSERHFSLQLPGGEVQVSSDGTYQLNVSVAHDSLMQLRLVIHHGQQTPGPLSQQQRVERRIQPTLLQLYDNKRRISRVDTLVNLCAHDRVLVVLVPVQTAGESHTAVSPNDPAQLPTPHPQQDVKTIWFEKFEPHCNSLSLVFLDQRFVYVGDKA